MKLKKKQNKTKIRCMLRTSTVDVFVVEGRFHRVSEARRFGCEEDAEFAAVPVHAFQVVRNPLSCVRALHNDFQVPRSSV